MKTDDKARYIIFIMLLTPILLTGNVFACSDAPSADGCPAIVEIDDNTAIFTGTWKKSNSILLWYGDDYEVVPGTAGDASATATFTSPADIEVEGDYSIYARWTAHPNRCTTATYKVYNGSVSPANLIATVGIDQTVNGGAWRRLVTTSLFTKDSLPRVVVENSGCAGKFVVADGIRIVKEDNDHNSIVDEPGVEFASGNQFVALGASDIIVRSITVTPPNSGFVIVHANGYWSYFLGDSIARCSIVQSPEIFVDDSHAIRGRLIVGDDMPFSGTRGFAVTKDTSATFNLVCDTIRELASVNDTSMSAVFSTTRY